MTHPQGEPETLPNVHQCIAKAMGLVSPVGKEGENTRDHYRFKRIDDFLTAANAAMAEAGVHVVPQVLTRITDETHTTSSGNVMRWVDLEVQFRFYGPAGDYVECVTWGEGRDASDKATNKALTAAMKYSLMYTLMVPTSDIQDADKDSPEAGESQQRQIEPPPPGRRAVSPEILALQQQILDVGERRKLSKAELVAEFAAWLPGQGLSPLLAIGTAGAVVLQGFIAHLLAAKPPAVPEGQEELPEATVEPPASNDEPPAETAAAYVPGTQPPPIPDDIEDRMARAKATAK